MKLRIIGFIVITVIWVLVGQLWRNSVEPQISADLGVAQVESREDVATTMRMLHANQDNVSLITFGGFVLLIFIFFAGPARRALSKCEE